MNIPTEDGLSRLAKLIEENRIQQLTSRDWHEFCVLSGLCRDPRTSYNWALAARAKEMIGLDKVVSQESASSLIETRKYPMGRPRKPLKLYRRGPRFSDFLSRSETA